MAADKFPRVVLVNILVVSLMGGLAGHDVSNVIGETSGMWVGALAGVFATVAMLVLMVTSLREAARQLFQQVALSKYVCLHLGYTVFGSCRRRNSVLTLS